MAIHDTIAATLAEMGLCSTPTALLRTVLIGGGYFAGEKYRFDGGCAVWLAERNVIEVYDDDGKLLKTITLGRLEGGEAA
jgi:hypothetical protein